MPVRYFETTTIYRDENTGQLQGLSACARLPRTIRMCLAKARLRGKLACPVTLCQTYATIGMELKIRLSTHRSSQMEKIFGHQKVWEESERNLREVVEENKKTYSIGVGEAAFYSQN